MSHTKKIGKNIKLEGGPAKVVQLLLLSSAAERTASLQLIHAIKEQHNFRTHFFFVSFLFLMWKHPTRDSISLNSLSLPCFVIQPVH